MTASPATMFKAGVTHEEHAGSTSERTTGELFLAAEPPLSFYDGRSNWLWLADIPQWDRALDVRSDVGPQTAGLAEHFRSVHCVRLERARLWREWQDLIAGGYANIAAACATPLHMPYRDRAFDCVALNDVSAQASRQDRILRECYRILRKGGCLFMGAPGRSVRRLTHDLTRTGFSAVHVFGAEPSWDEPRCIIPLNRAAILAYERWVRRSSPLRDFVRCLLARLGCRPILYRSVIVLAYR
jgi:SAM-dependent methyltransferase